MSSDEGRWATAAGSSVADALASVGEGGDVESVTRPLLAALQEMTGLGTTFLTSIDWSAAVQTIEFASAGGPLTMPEQVGLPWEQTLCRRAMDDDLVSTNEVQKRWGDNGLASAMGVQTYVSSPVELADGAVWGTLCGASTDVLGVGDHTTMLLRVFSGLIADAIERDLELETSRSRAEHAELRLRQRAMFLATAEHKLKTPLTVLTGWAELLTNPQLPPETHDDAVRAIGTATKRLTMNVTEMLNEASAHVVAAELAPTTFELEPFLTDLARDLGMLSTRHPVRVEIPADVRVHMDSRSLRIIVEHLVENAVKYSPDGGEVVIIVDPVVDKEVTFRVVDHGPGLPADVDLFAPFARGNTDIEGTGLGLHIVRSLAEAMRGRADGRNLTGGAELTVVLPVA